MLSRGKSGPRLTISDGGVQADHSALGHARAELPNLELSTEFPRLGVS
jgi:hypothetical protein